MSMVSSEAERLIKKFSVNGYKVNSDDGRIPDFVKYASFMCLYCENKSLYYYQRKCDFEKHKYFKYFDNKTYNNDADISITVGAIFLTHIYRYYFNKKYVGDAYLKGYPELSQMKRIEELEFADEKDIMLLSYLQDRVPFVIERNKFEFDSWILPAEYRKSICKLVKMKFETLASFYINQFNECKKYSTSSKRISEIKIEGLFGYHSYKLSFNTNESISIIYGTNGMGKTTLFKILKALLIEYESFEKNYNNKNYENFKYLCEEVPFNSFTLSFADDSSITMIKNKTIISISYNKRGNNVIGNLKFSVNNKNFENNVKNHYKFIKILFPIVNSNNRFLFINTHRDGVLSSVSNLLNDFIKKNEEKNLLSAIFGEKESQDISSNSLDEIRRIKNYINSSSTGVTIDLTSAPKSMMSSIDIMTRDYESYQMSFKDYDPLNNHDSDKPMPLYFEGALLELKNNELFNDYVKHFKLKTSFRPHKTSVVMELAKRPIEDVLDDEELKKSFLVDRFNSELLNLCFLKQKYEFFKKAFEEFYNEYDPSYKKLILNLGENPKFLYKCSNGTTIDDSKLSSGEINLLTILYSIAFNTTRDSIILIDEPEISLHMLWVQQLTTTISNMVKSRGNQQIIMSSHSPFLAAGHEEYLVEGELLEEGE